jgi:hypothetical protein
MNTHACKGFIQSCFLLNVLGDARPSAAVTCIKVVDICDTTSEHATFGEGNRRRNGIECA